MRENLLKAIDISLVGKELRQMRTGVGGARFEIPDFQGGIMLADRRDLVHLEYERRIRARDTEPDPIQMNEIGSGRPAGLTVRCALRLVDHVRD